VIPTLHAVSGIMTEFVVQGTKGIEGDSTSARIIKEFHWDELRLYSSNYDIVGFNECDYASLMETETWTNAMHSCAYSACIQQFWAWQPRPPGLIAIPGSYLGKLDTLSVMFASFKSAIGTYIHSKTIFSVFLSHFLPCHR
jgi:hypothetical protein